STTSGSTRGTLLGTKVQASACQCPKNAVRSNSMGRKTSVAAPAAAQVAQPAGSGSAVPDYETADVLLVREPEQLKARADQVRDIVAISLRVAADEILPLNYRDPEAIACSGVLRVRLSAKDADRFNRRLDKLMEEFRDAEVPDGIPYGLALAMYRRAPD